MICYTTNCWCCCKPLDYNGFFKNIECCGINHFISTGNMIRYFDKLKIIYFARENATYLSIYSSSNKEQKIDGSDLFKLDQERCLERLNKLMILL
jgi:hypothetical protein